jgi:hypothetical protein
MRRVTTRAFLWNAAASALPIQPGPKPIGLETLVGAAQLREQQIDRMQIMALALGQTERDGTPAPFNDRGQLGN